MVKVLALGLLLALAVFPVLFLAGLASAAWEIRREKRAGLVPTRPAWENRDKRRALGGLREQVRVAWQQARKPMRSCWCGRGPLVEFQASGGFDAGWGCAAWEAGDQVAILRHDAAGGYSRSSSGVSVGQGWS